MKKIKITLALLALLGLASCSPRIAVGTTDGIRSSMDPSFILEGVDESGNEWYWSDEFITEEINFVSEDGMLVTCIAYLTTEEIANNVYNYLDDSTYQCYGNYCIGKIDMFIFIHGAVYNEDVSLIIQQPLMRKRFIDFDKYKK